MSHQSLQIKSLIQNLVTHDLIMYYGKNPNKEHLYYIYISRMLNVSECNWLEIICIILKLPVPFIWLHLERIEASKGVIFFLETWIFILNGRVLQIHSSSCIIRRSFHVAVEICIKLGHNALILGGLQPALNILSQRVAGAAAMEFVIIRVCSGGAVHDAMSCLFL